MWHFRLWDVQDVAVFLSIALYMCHLAGAISIHSPQKSLTRSVQEDVFFSVDITCDGIPTIQWTFMSGAVSRTIGTWQPGLYTNITVDYSSRVQHFNNGSMGLSDLRLADAGYYQVTVTETAGSSKDAGFVLKVNEVLYEDLQYLSVSALALACLTGLLMLVMWLLDKVYRKIVAWKRRKEMPENDATELQPL
ncbi:V-set and transmembrane domain-containing protein 5 [Micropterus dolomieu]|uniref:V-set and transmembrane domain-containing protein 5 n=1 Tax=Micropterus dolomieu TaxID=147949 RepID=UPI001E8D960D|nr:V-set and transmembrane domain-containing protein 5 [Micropterus dolomieu]XP_045929292.1 V-set and transmembrane domain-containing protein 5 [Micropterus dolomieu]XP_045929293.1 V-set and transmembrane domain-containing protein 5 [Micropterus dolomieu]XP_045929294.1 V-set and transmembrane domain-containing protein 5 [Micropterus dolomieu]XP_045929295.1 V-set and transmembrane domain-containing protein 5 [Micropterus dolomieu]XP_045929296.1 V-set and transmembrane domain-containing protein 